MPTLGLLCPYSGSLLTLVRSTQEADRRFGALLTNEHAMGLVLATGNVGTALEQEPEEATMFVSRDAGVSWNKVMDGVLYRDR